MTLIGLIIVLIVVGAALYLLNLLPIDATVKQVIRVVVIVILIIYALLFVAGLLGLATGLPGVQTR